MDAAMRANLLALVDAEIGVERVSFDRWGSWALLEMPGFAGPMTKWRAVALADSVGTQSVKRGDGYEVLSAAGWGRIVVDVDVDTPAQRERWLEPLASGATLGEIVDVSEAQGGLLDASVAAALLAPFVTNAHGIDQILAGFDGSLRARPGWPYREGARRFGSTVRTSADDVAELAVELFESKRFVAGTHEFAGHDDAVRAAAGAVYARHTRRGRGGNDLRHDDVMSRARELCAVVQHADPDAIGAVVRSLFPERWRREQRVLEAVLG